MRAALQQAELAAARGEVPVGAVIVRDGEIVARGHNLREVARDPCAHAELVAVRAAAARLDSWRLSRCTLYVTLEPCVMCAGVLQQARIGRVVYGAADPKGGALGSLFKMHQDVRLNHRYPVVGGVLAQSCGEILTQFFRSARQHRKPRG